MEDFPAFTKLQPKHLSRPWPKDQHFAKNDQISPFPFILFNRELHFAATHRRHSFYVNPERNKTLPFNSQSVNSLSTPWLSNICSLVCFWLHSCWIFNSLAPGIGTLRKGDIIFPRMSYSVSWSENLLWRGQRLLGKSSGLRRKLFDSIESTPL